MTDNDTEGVRRTDCSPWHDEETLRYYYHEREFSLLETAGVLGCSEGTVSKWCNRLEIETRDASEARDHGTPEDFKDERRIRELYLTLELTCSEIAGEYGVTDKTVSDWLRRHGIPTRSANRRRKRATVTCEACGSEFEVHEGRSGEAKYCSRGCYYDDMEMPTGEDHWSWNGGHGGPDYGPGWDNEKKRSVRLRDGHECVECGLSQGENLERNGCKLHVHHLIDPRQSTNPAVYNAPRNLKTVCNRCHRILHGK